MTPRDERAGAELAAVEALEGARAAARVPGLNPAERRRRELEAVRARNALVLLALGVIFRAARRYARAARSLEEGDLVAVGVIEAIAAVDRYRPSEGSFVPFAAVAVRRAMVRACVDLDDAIRIPANAAFARRRVDRTRDRFRRAHGRAPSPEELAHASDLTPIQIARLLAIPCSRASSLDAPADEEGHPWVNMLAGDDVGPEELLAQADRERVLRELVVSLPSRDGRIIFARARGASLEAIGASVGRTKERIRQIEAHGLELLREAAPAAGL